MKKIILAFFLLLTACGTTHQDTGLARPPEIPELPDNLAQRATSRPQLIDPTLGGLMEQAADDDAAYNARAHQVNNLIDLYNCVRDSINNGKEIKCL